MTLPKYTKQQLEFLQADTSGNLTVLERSLVAQLLAAMHVQVKQGSAPDWILTHSGKRFSFQDINPDAINIEDIATALSNICRFTGHLDQHYSVAQHCVLVSHLVEPHLAFEALMHDASEAYCGDVSSPLKARLPDYREIEGRVDRAIRAKYGLPLVESPEVKVADLRMLATEMGMFCRHSAQALPDPAKYPPADMMGLRLLPAEEARVAFLQRFELLYPGG